MNTWKNDRDILIENLKKRYGVEDLNIPMFLLQEFVYKGNNDIQNAKMKAISRFMQRDILIEKYDRLSGCFDGNSMHCFYRTFLPNELSYQFESLLKKYNILHEKLPINNKYCYACDIAKIPLRELSNINDYSSDSITYADKIIEETSNKLLEKIL